MKSKIGIKILFFLSVIPFEHRKKKNKRFLLFPIILNGIKKNIQSISQFQKCLAKRILFRNKISIIMLFYSVFSACALLSQLTKCDLSDQRFLNSVADA